MRHLRQLKLNCLISLSFSVFLAYFTLPSVPSNSIISDVIHLCFCSSRILELTHTLPLSPSVSLSIFCKKGKADVAQRHSAQWEGRIMQFHQVHQRQQ